MNDAFHAERRTGIGGSDIAAIVGADFDRTPLDVYNEKMGLAPPAPTNPHIRRGVLFEPIARQMYIEQTGNKVAVAGLRRMRDHEIVIGHVDGLVAARDGVPAGVLEIKCPGIGMWGKIKREGLPMKWVLQAQWYMAVTSRKWCDVAVFNAEFAELHVLRVDADSDLQRQLVERAEIWWTTHIVRQSPPTTDVEPIVLPAWDGRVAKRTDEEWGAAVEAYRAAKEVYDASEALVAAGKDRLLELMGADAVVEGAGVRIYNTPQDGRLSFDRKLLENLKPLDRAKVFEALAEAHDVPDAVIKAIGDCSLDLSKLERRGKPFTTFRLFTLKPQETK